MEWVSDILGLEQGGGGITWWQTAIRAVIVFLFTILLIRVGKTRAFGRNSSLDIVMAVILGSVLSRAITASSPFFPTLVAACALVALHWLLAVISFRVPYVGPMVKGGETQLVRDGEMLWDAMADRRITERDLKEAMRKSGGPEDVSRVRAAWLERSGDISVVRRED